MVFGGVAGLLRSSSPTLFALASGAQWFSIGGTYWGEDFRRVFRFYYNLPMPTDSRSEGPDVTELDACTPTTP